MTVIPFGPRPTRDTRSGKTEPQSHRDMDVWPRPSVALPVPIKRPTLTLVR